MRLLSRIGLQTFFLEGVGFGWQITEPSEIAQAEQSIAELQGSHDPIVLTQPEPEE